MQSLTGLVERLDGLLPIHYHTSSTTLDANKLVLNELRAQLLPFWPRVRWYIEEREDGVRVVHLWQAPEAPGGELQLFLEPLNTGAWVCVNLDHDLSPTLVATADTLGELVGAVCAALEVGLQARGVAA